MRENGQRLFIARAELARAHLGPDPDAPAQRLLAPGQARLAVEAFSLTANNVTYAAFGEAMKYWQFFLSGDAALGCLPVWGFATVSESLAEGLAPGRRVWGYYPAGTHLVVAPSKVSEVPSPTTGIGSSVFATRRVVMPEAGTAVATVRSVAAAIPVGSDVAAIPAAGAATAAASNLSALRRSSKSCMVTIVPPEARAPFSRRGP